jgi:hypothetical protein
VWYYLLFRVFWLLLSISICEILRHEITGGPIKEYEPGYATVAESKWLPSAIAYWDHVSLNERDIPLLVLLLQQCSDEILFVVLDQIGAFYVHQRRFRYWLARYPACCMRKRPNKGTLGQCLNAPDYNCFFVKVDKNSLANGCSLGEALNTGEPMKKRVWIQSKPAGTSFGIAPLSRLELWSTARSQR